MKKVFFLPAFFLITLAGLAQTDSTIDVKLAQYVKDDRFDKYQLTLALFLAKSDTIFSMDFEGTKPAKPIQIVKPDGFKLYGYGYIFFSGSSNPYNPGYVSVLVGNPYHKNPTIFVDENQNFDFTNRKNINS